MGDILPGMISEDFPILAAVAVNPSHSYQVIEHLEALGVHATRSTLYRRVDTLIALGLLAVTEARGARGHRRRDLAITEPGRDILADHTGAVVRTEPMESPLFALAVSCAAVVNVEGLDEVLRRRMANAARRLTEEERALGLTEGVEEMWRTAGRERRIAHLQADVAWLQSMVARSGGRRPLRRAG